MEDEATFSASWVRVEREEYIAHYLLNVVHIYIVHPIEIKVVLTVVAVSVAHIPSTLIHLDVAGKLAVGLEAAALVWIVLENNVSLLVLKITQAHQNDIPHIDPDFFAQLAANVAEPLLAVDALRLHTAISEHLEDLRVLLPLLLENELTFFGVVILPTATIFAPFALFAGHVDCSDSQVARRARSSPPPGALATLKFKVGGYACKYVPTHRR